MDHLGFASVPQEVILYETMLKWSQKRNGPSSNATCEVVQISSVFKCTSDVFVNFDHWFLEVLRRFLKDLVWGGGSCFVLRGFQRQGLGLFRRVNTLVTDFLK